jgi:NitT/TauT family transport system permease protein
VSNLVTDAEGLSAISAADVPRRRSWRPSSGVVMPVLTVALILGVWELVTRAGWVPSYDVPPMSDVVKYCFNAAGTLMPAAWVTTREALIGFGLSIAVGVPLAIIMVSSRMIENSLYPLIVTSQVVPKVAIAPLIVVWFGFGWFPKALLVFLLAFFPVVINAVIGLRSVEIEKLYLVQSMGASRFQTFWRIRLPQALPAIFGGVKLAATLSVIGAIVAEFVGADAGLGYLIEQSNGSLDTVTLFACLVYLSVIGYLFFVITEIVERMALPWHVSRRTRSAS